MLQECLLCLLCFIIIGISCILFCMCLFFVVFDLGVGLSCVYYCVMVIVGCWWYQCVLVGELMYDGQYCFFIFISVQLEIYKVVQMWGLCIV